MALPGGALSSGGFGSGPFGGGGLGGGGLGGGLGPGLGAGGNNGPWPPPRSPTMDRFGPPPFGGGSPIVPLAVSFSVGYLLFRLLALGVILLEKGQSVS